MTEYLRIERWADDDFSLRGRGVHNTRFWIHAKDMIEINWGWSDHTVLFFDLENGVTVADLITGFEEFYTDHRSV